MLLLLLLLLTCVMLCVSCSHGAQLVSGVQEEVVDGDHSDHGEPAVLGSSAGLGLAAHHAEKRRLLLSPVHR